jgi:hypothetical protein
MIEILGVLAIMFNLALVFFTGHYLADMPWQYRWTLLVLLEHVAVGLRFAVQMAISDVPREVQIQLGRCHTHALLSLLPVRLVRHLIY